MKQTFIAVLQDRNFNMVTFERFGCRFFQALRLFRKARRDRLEYQIK